MKLDLCGEAFGLFDENTGGNKVVQARSIPTVCRLYCVHGSRVEQGLSAVGRKELEGAPHEYWPLCGAMRGPSLRLIVWRESLLNVGLHYQQAQSIRSTVVYHVRTYKEGSNMKMRIAFPLLLTLLFLGLAGTSALAASITLFTTTPPETPSPVGFGPLGPLNPTNPVPAVSWNCAFVGGCNVTDFHYYEFNDQPGVSPSPTLMNEVWFGATPYSTTYAAFSAPIVPGNVSGLGCFSIAATTWCNQSLIFSPFHVPQGPQWITIYGENTTDPPSNFWSNSGNPSIISTTLSMDPTTGVISGYPSQLAFTVTGSPAVPEPSSMLLLGSGVVGLAGVLRRKLMR